MLSVSVIVVVLYLIKLRLGKNRTPDIKGNIPFKKRGKGNVDAAFFKRLVVLLKIVIPGWKSKEVFDITLLTLLLVARTFLSIYISTINGRIVKAIIKLDLQLFIRRVYARHNEFKI